MPKKNTLLLSLVVICLLVYSGYVFISLMRHPKEVIVVKEISQELPPENILAKHIGEKIIYTVKLGNVSMGKAVFRHLPMAQLEGKPVYLMTLETRLFKFYDLERIYSDPQSFLPIRIERQISNWPLSERITESYDQRAFTLVISKNEGKNIPKQLIQKDRPIHNSVIFPFYLRTLDNPETGWSMTANLPTQKFEIKFDGIEKISLPAGDFKAYHFRSSPDKFEVWISADEKRIPLRIKSSGALGYTLVFKEYSMEK